MENVLIHDNINTRHGNYAVITSILAENKGYKTSVYPLNKSCNPVYKKPVIQYEKIFFNEDDVGLTHVQTIIDLGYVKDRALCNT